MARWSRSSSSRCRTDWCWSSLLARPFRIRRLLVVVIEGMRFAPRVGGDEQLVAVLVEAIDERGDARGARKHGAPLLEREIGGDDCRALGVPAADDVVKDVGGAACARDAAELTADQPVSPHL